MYIGVHEPWRTRMRGVYAWQRSHAADGALHRDRLPQLGVSPKTGMTYGTQRNVTWTAEAKFRATRWFSVDLDCHRCSQLVAS